MKQFRVALLLLAVALEYNHAVHNPAYMLHDGPQTDLASDEMITVCTGKKTEIQCREGSNIAITNAFWGRTSDKVCPSDDGDPVTDCQGSRDTKGLLRASCENKRKCQLEARHAILQKPGSHHCPGVNKYLVLRYSCVPESQSLLLCNDVESELKCNAGWKMDVGEVFWGRQDHSQGMCLTEDAAFSGTECPSSRYAEQKIRSMCNATSKCKVKASRDELEDPNKKHRGLTDCDLKEKYLKVTYFCRPPEYFGETEAAPTTHKKSDDSRKQESEKKPASKKEDTDKKSPTTRKVAKTELLGALKEHIDNLAKKKSEVEDDEHMTHKENVKLAESLAAKTVVGTRRDETPETPDERAKETKEEAKVEKKEEKSEAKKTEKKDDDAKEQKKPEGKKDEEAKKEEEAKKVKSEDSEEGKVAKEADKKDDDGKKEGDEKKAADPKKEDKNDKKEVTKEKDANKKEEASKDTKKDTKKEREQQKEEPSETKKKDTEVKTEKKDEDTERTTVKSILARAREVLKNLDGESSFLKRKSLIGKAKRNPIPHPVEKKSSIIRPVVRQAYRPVPVAPAYYPVRQG